MRHRTPRGFETNIWHIVCRKELQEAGTSNGDDATCFPSGRYDDILNEPKAPRVAHFSSIP